MFNRVNSNQKVCSVDDFPHYKLDPFAYKYFSKLRNICFERGKIRTGSASSFEKCWVHYVASNQTHNLSRFRKWIFNEMNILWNEYFSNHRRTKHHKGKGCMVIGPPFVVGCKAITSRINLCLLPFQYPLMEPNRL